MLDFIYVLIGLGMVIFVHELGHFLAARAVGIKVKKFAIGFGPRLFGIVRGETDYCVNALPIGGYVAMLGQEDFKANEEMTDPGAYPNRPVWARLIVISAGVVMNLIFAALLFVMLFMIGYRYIAPVVGDVDPTMPAAKIELPGDRGVGLQPGDRVVSIDGRQTRKFTDLMIAGLLGGADRQFTLGIERPMPDGGTDRFDVTLSPKEAMGPTGTPVAMFGIGRPATTTVVVGDDGLMRRMGFEDGDVIIEYDGQPVEHGWQITSSAYHQTGEPVSVKVRREGVDEPVALTIQPQLTWSEHYLVEQLDSEQGLPSLHVLGLQPRLMVAGVLPETPAAEAGIEAGDVIVSIGDPPMVPTIEDLRRVLDEYNGRAAPVRVLRDGEVVSLEVGSSGRQGRRQMGIGTGVDMTHLVVADVREDSPLAGQLPRGATIRSVIAGEQATPVDSWSDLIAALRVHEGETIALGYASPSGAEEITEPIELTAERFAPGRYAFAADPPRDILMTEPVQTWNPITAASWGVRETIDFVLQGYMTIGGLITGRVDHRNVSGPVGIFRAGAQMSESRGILGLVSLFGMISALLAVFNFLPLPILDGGHAVLLLIERVRGKPVSMKVQNAIQLVGLIAFAGLFLLITFNDIVQWLQNPW